MSGPKTYGVDIGDSIDMQYIRQKLIKQTQRIDASSLSMIEEIKKKISSELSCSSSAHTTKTITTQSYTDKVSKIFWDDGIELPKNDIEEVMESKDNSNLEEYNTAVENYVKACYVLGKLPDDCFELTAENFDEVISVLNVETERMMKEAADRLVKQKIYSQSMEALKEMGYEVIGEKKSVSPNGSSIDSTLVRVNENIGVNMVCIDGSKFTYEVVGLTEDNHSVTENEIENITSAMIGMCHTDFTTYLEKLSSKGLVVKDLVDRSVEKRFCKNKNILEYSSVPIYSDESEELSYQKFENREGSTI